ncbi:MAG TPA: ankyrin repeat domain-containing protein [Symbiobacteriaceae bacterium]|jgi:ankyrin repeat protein|nr:ankyrin repeat domain-containing protein [Symbiobacteriaceae bacterium]
MTQAEEMIAAVKARDAARVQALLQQEPALAATPTDDGSLLLTAVYYGAGEAAALIRRYLRDLTVWEAATVGDLDRLATLLEQEASLANAPGPGGMRPLHLAAFFRQTEAVRLLLARGADPLRYGLYQQPFVPRNTALHAALAGGAWEAARLLVEAGANVHAVDSEGLVPLHNAAFAGHIPSAELLLAHGAEVNVPDKNRETPLTKAVKQGKTECADFLRQHGAVE